MYYNHLILFKCFTTKSINSRGLLFSSKLQLVDRNKSPYFGSCLCNSDMLSLGSESSVVSISELVKLFVFAVKIVYNFARFSQNVRQKMFDSRNLHPCKKACFIVYIDFTLGPENESKNNYECKLVIIKYIIYKIINCWGIFKYNRDNRGILPWFISMVCTNS